MAKSLSVYSLMLFCIMSIISCSSTVVIDRSESNQRDDSGIDATLTIAAVVGTTNNVVDIALSGSGWLRMLAQTHDHVFVARLENEEVVVWGAYTTRSFDDVIQIAHGTNHTTLLHNDGTVSTYGDAALGQTNVPVINERIRKIVAGETFSVGLTESGRVVGWGQAVVNRDGSQLAITPYPLDVSNAVDSSQRTYDIGSSQLMGVSNAEVMQKMPSNCINKSGVL